MFVTCHIAKLSLDDMGNPTIVISFLLILSVVGNLNNARTTSAIGDDEIAGKIKNISKIEQFEADCDKFEFPKIREIICWPEIWCFGILRSCMESSCNVFFSCSEELALADDKLKIEI